MSQFKILVINLMHIGDLLLVTPVLRTLRTNYPQAQIALLADAKLSDLVKYNQNIDELIAIDKKGYHNKLGNYLRFVADIRRRHFDLVINLHANERASFIAAFSGADRIIGYSSWGLGVTFDYCIKNRKAIKHQIHSHFDVLQEGLGITRIDDRGIEMWLDDAAKKSASEIWFKAFPGSGCHYQAGKANAPKSASLPFAMTNHVSIKAANDSVIARSDSNAVISKRGSDVPAVIGLNIGASWPTKRWLKEYYAELADRLLEKGLGVAYFGGPMDEELVRQTVALMKHKDHSLLRIFTGKLTLLELAALLKKCAVFVTNDSGPMHIAVAMDVPLVTMFGASPVPGFYPYNSKSILLKTPAECHPCGVHTCEHLKCMKQIPVDEVMKYTLQLLQQYGEQVGHVPRDYGQYQCRIVEL